jgi:hypothetical protein
VWFRLDAHPGLEVVLTVNEGGELEGFEVHVQGGPRSLPENLAEYGGEYGPAEVPPPPDQVEAPPVTATLLRELPFREMTRLARSSLGCHMHWHQERFDEYAAMLQRSGLPGARTATTADLMNQAEEQTRRRSPRDKGDQHYAELATAYEDWVATGKPLQALADEQKIFNVNTLRSQLQEARQRGMLTDATRTKAGEWVAGGWATDKAKRLLKEDDMDPVPHEEPF